MSKSRFFFLLTGAALIGLTACAVEPTDKQKLKTSAHFWQRANVTEASYMNGPKAQQMLNRDISRCVTEIRELDRLGAIRAATPGDTKDNGMVPNPQTPEGAMDQWETPERDGYLYAEHFDYHDFETCMQYKGWERLEHVPYDIAEESREMYIEEILHEQYRTDTGQRTADDAGDKDFEDLND